MRIGHGIYSWNNEFGKIFLPNLFAWLYVLKVKYNYYENNGILNIYLPNDFLITYYTTKHKAVVLKDNEIVYNFKNHLTWARLVSYIRYRQKFN